MPPSMLNLCIRQGGVRRLGSSHSCTVTGVSSSHAGKGGSGRCSVAAPRSFPCSMESMRSSQSGESTCRDFGERSPSCRVEWTQQQAEWRWWRSRRSMLQHLLCTSDFIRTKC